MTHLVVAEKVILDQELE